MHFILLQPISLFKKIILAHKRVCCIQNISYKARFSVFRTKIPFYLIVKVKDRYLDISIFRYFKHVS